MRRTGPRTGPLSRGKRLLLWLLLPILRLWWRTLRIQLSPGLLPLAARSGPLIWAFWHRNLFLAGYLRRLLRREVPVWALVSASGDGEWLAELLQRLAVGAIRGSSSRGGGAAYAAALEKLALGEDIAVTPDGPRGPALHCKPGVVQLALAAAVPIVALRLHFSRAIRLHSWDRFQIPLPFSRITVEGQPILPETLAGLGEREALCRHLDEALGSTSSLL
ncbi:MAG: DUF374 domain-containing protein [Puniceicoccales bacterium]|jgi:lysophospholipid acyltransferase (LPLAT)-like uncharacterized protein|nr:DUF374 domain-containing protein [Puniceicoccales bacterium]